MLLTLLAPQPSGGTLSVEVSWAQLNVPGTAISATQTVPAFTQTATAEALISLSATQTVPAFTQTATVEGSTDNDLAATQTVPAFAQTATVEALIALSATQTVPALTQVATLQRVTGALSVEVSWAEFRFPGGGTLSSLSAAQTVPAITQTATLDQASKSLQVSWAQLNVPDTALATLGISATQTVPAFAQVATMYDVVGTITGGGTITEDLPHRSLTATQTVPPMTQAATLGDAPDIRTLSAAQLVPAITQSGAMDASRTLLAVQTVPDCVQSAFIGDPVGARRRGGGAPGRPRKIVVQVDGERFIVDSPEEARALLAKAEETAQEAARAKAQELASRDRVRMRAARRAAPVVRIETPEPAAEPMPEAVDEIAAIRAEAQAVTERLQKMYEDALQTALIAKELHKRIDQDEIEALTALLL